LAYPRESADRLVSLGIILVFLFVSFVPHRFLPPTHSVPWIPPNVISFLPSVVTGLLLFLCVFRNAQRTPISSNLHLPLLALVAFDFLSGISSEIPAVALSRQVYYGLTGICIAFLVFSTYTNGPRLARLIDVSIVGAACVALYGVCEFLGTQGFWDNVFVQSNLRYARFASDEFSGRILGPVGHPVYLGAYLVLFLPLSLTTAMSAQSWRACSFWFCTGTILVALLLTFTRGAWMGGIVSLIYVLRGQSRGRAGCAVFVLGFLVVSIMSVDEVWETVERRSPLRQLEGYRKDARGTAYAQASGVLLRNPLLGWGSGHYRHLGRLQGDQNGTPDNAYLRVLAEGGAIGLTALLFLFLEIYKRFRRSEQATVGWDSDICRAITAGVLGFWVDLITCDALHFPLTRISFWMVIGMGLAAGEKSLSAKLECTLSDV
jgi:O-antigen ligase